MKKVVLFAALALSVTVCVAAQDATRQVSTSTVDGSRFEMIQSPLDNVITFRLDKWTGTVDRLGSCPKDDSFGSRLCWKEMVVLDLPRQAPAAKIRYQIVFNLSWKFTMLMQIDTGRTWQLGVDPQDRWAPFIDCTDKSNSVCLWRPVGG